MKLLLMMKRFVWTLAAASCVALLIAAPAGADFGFKEVDVTFTGPDGSPSMQAGSHPFAVTTTLDVNTTIHPEIGEVPDGMAEDVIIDLPAGFVGTPNPVPYCPTDDFVHLIEFGQTACPNSSVIGAGTLRVGLDGGPGQFDVPIYNLAPPPGAAAKIGFMAALVPVAVEIRVNPEPPYNVVASATNISQAALFYGSKVSLWGNPADAVHDTIRGSCLDVLDDDPEGFSSLGNCPVSIPEKPFITLPRSCTGPLTTTFTALAWNTGKTDSRTATTHDNSIPPNPLGMTGCSKLGFAPKIASQPTTDHAESPSGLDFTLEIDDEGLVSPDGIAQSDIRKAVVTLPKGVTVNPSAAGGLLACTPEDYKRETVDSAPGQGCPEASKIGNLEVETPLLEGELLKGSLFVAQQDDPATATPGAENPFDTLIALYMVIKHPKLGIIVKLAGKVEPRADTGQLTTTFDDLPQLPFSDFRLHFREGGRSPLISPPACGAYTTEARFTPWANPTKTLTTTSTFQITRGVSGGPCPPAGRPPFAPGFDAGSINNNAGSYSPFDMRLTRADGEQDMTRFSSVLPPGLLGKLAGVGKCADGAIAAAKAKTGRQELASPSCPVNSQIGRTLGGAGVGSQLTYVPGKLYLAGPFAGDPLSVVAVTPAVAGPFDAGTVVVRVALDVDRKTGEVQADGLASDPIPHILKGIPLKVRDLRVYVDRNNFILNPTSCNPMQVKATLWGGGIEPFSILDDAPVPLAARFQAANCANLGFKPRLSFNLKGGIRRGGHPALRAVLRPRPGDANLSRAVVRLPSSAFLDQGHIRTICTRVQFAADSCPSGAAYGHVKAFSPLLDEPLQGPVYLRSSDNLLPDLVFDLKGLVEIEAVGRIDSIKGGIRATFNAIPDAPVSKVVVSMQGGKKGLIVNSRNLCATPSRAVVKFTGQNGKERKLRPLVRPDCRKRKRPAKGQARSRRAR